MAGRIRNGWLAVGWFILWARPVVAADYSYVTNADETLTITAYQGTGGEVVVPGEIGGRAVTGIGDLAFYEMDNLSRITIPDSVKWIGADVFMFCHGLETVTLGAFVAQIGSDAFYECSRLAAMQIPASTTNIGGDAFGRCTSLTSITVAVSNPMYRDIAGILYNKALTTLIQYPCGKAGNLYLPGPVVVVRDRALAYCGELRNVALGASVTNIGTGTFRSSRKLEGVYFAGAVPAHGADVFNDVNRTTVYRSADASGWGSVFEGRPVSTWPAAADFSYAENATDTNTLTVTVYAGAATEISIPAFLAEEPGKTITRIGSQAFQLQTNLVGVVISSALREIGTEAFYGCSRLATLSVTDSVTNLGERAFMACTGLTNLIIGAGVVRAGDGVFAGCPLLTGVHFRGDAPAAGAGLFDSSPLVTTYYWPPRAGWGTAYGGRPTAIWFSPDDFTFTTNGYDTNSVTITSYQGADQIVPIPSQIHGRTVTEIGYRALYGQRDVTWVSVPASVTNIDAEAFLSSYALTNLVVTGGVRRIGDRAFAQTPMERIVLPASVASLGSGAFEFCSMGGIYLEGDAPEVSGDIADPDSSAIVYYLPGMNGWGATLGGRPTAPWLPRIQSDHFGATTTGYEFNVDWARGRTVVLEGCDSLTAPVWTPLATNTLADGIGRMVDPAWTNHAARYYRLCEL